MSINDIYLSADEMEADGIHVFSTDEKTGIQTREHKNPKITMGSGKPECIDSEYIRHGTTGLIASRNIATGEMAAPMIQPNRKEEDFAKNIRDVVCLDPEAHYCFIMDNLNTHKSEALVSLAAGLEGMDEEELGVKGRSGILQSMKSREEYLVQHCINSGELNCQRYPCICPFEWMRCKIILFYKTENTFFKLFY